MQTRIQFAYNFEILLLHFVFIEYSLNIYINITQYILLYSLTYSTLWHAFTLSTAM